MVEDVHQALQCIRVLCPITYVWGHPNANHFVEAVFIHRAFRKGVSPLLCWGIWSLFPSPATWSPHGGCRHRSRQMPWGEDLDMDKNDWVCMGVGVDKHYGCFPNEWFANRASHRLSWASTRRRHHYDRANR